MLETSGPSVENCWEAWWCWVSQALPQSVHSEDLFSEKVPQNIEMASLAPLGSAR